MLASISVALICTKIKVENWFRRAFKEQAGGAEVIATLIIVAVVLALALAFKDKLTQLVKNLWNNITNDGSDYSNPEIPQWN